MSSYNERILVIGATGEIGLNIFKHLKKLGYYCRGTSRKKNNSSNFLIYDLLDNIDEKIKIFNKKFENFDKEISFFLSNNSFD